MPHKHGAQMEDKTKIIIQNDSDLSMIDCLRLVEKVVEYGRVSNN